MQTDGGTHQGYLLYLIKWLLMEMSFEWKLVGQHIE